MITRRTTHIGFSTIAGTLLTAGMVGVATLPGTVAHAAPATKPALVATAQRPRFGRILVNGHGFALYYWSRETRGRVECTGQCAVAWPPLLIPKGTLPPRHIAGVMGTFGVAMRPDGSHQLTLNHHPLYTYQGDRTPRQILCDNVDGWHVYRLSH